jgi:thiamine biosynthesis lipoprotein
MPFPSDHPTNRLDHDPRTALSGPAYEWPLWSTTMRVVTADPHALPSARRLVETELAHVELAASRGRRDAEVGALPTGRRTRISGTLAAILGAALRAAEATDGAADPTAGRALRPVGDEDPWRGIELDEAHQTVLVPRGVELDLDPIARAWAADRCAAVVADVLAVGVLVSLGGDIATAGPAGGGAWEVLVADPPGSSYHDHPLAALVAIPTGLAVVTSTSTSTSTSSTGETSPFRTATVVAPDCVTATTWSAAALGADGPARLTERGLPARLVGVDGSLAYLGGWPEDGELAPTRRGC